MTKTRKNFQRALSLALALLFALSLSPALFHAKAVGSALTIETADELRDFIKKCAMDSYSKGLSVSLEADIDLGGSSINSIPIFYGSFDGGGFTISNFSIKTKGSQIGFFRSIEAGASVSNLTLNSEHAPKGTANCVGILAGENRGIISGCKVSGSVTGNNDVGGIVGINDYGGIITGCSSEAAVSGKLRIGGIAGSNSGTIEATQNKGNVNTDASNESSFSGLSDITDITDMVTDSVSDAVTDSVTGAEAGSADREEALSAGVSDTGGITGLNTGAIRGCTNRGAVGYKHVGYNTGGIAGTHNGIISSCENYGEILGRKDVGGIVGQFEPDMAVTFGVSSGAELENQIAGLTTILRNLTDTLSKSTDSSLTSADDINKAVGVIEDTLKTHADIGGEELEITLDTLYGNLQIINTAADKINQYVSDFNTVASKELPTITSELETISVALEEAKVSGEAADIIAQLDSINAQIAIISDALAGIETLISGISDALQDDNPDNRAQITELLNAYYESVDDDAISSAISSISSSLTVISAKLKTINSKLSKSSAVIIQSMQIISSSAARLQKAFTDFTGGVSVQAGIINANMDKIEDLLYGYSSDAGERLEATFDTVYIQLNTINTSLSDIITTADATNVEVYTLLNSAIDQLDQIGSSVSALMDPPQYSTVDVSDTIEQAEKPGQISSSRNVGVINADANVGGIAGIMALEMSTDPEEDFSMQDSLWVDTTALFRAIVMTCSNEAAITAKNDCAGGIVGRCDLGAIYKADNLGTAETTGGNNCGGVAGRSNGSIISCNALCDLTGNDYVGGVAGLGKNISNCRAMVRLFSDGECLGAIAGDADGDILDNAFVDEDLQGIDGISYAGVAYPLPYEEFTSLEFISPIFTDLHADFYIDGKLIKQVPLTYGGSIKSWDIPHIPAREDSFGVWEDFRSENTLRSERIDAVFSPWISALSSPEEPPLLLAEGEFSNEGVVEIEDTTPKLSLGGGSSKVLATYAYSVSDPVAPSAEEYLLHLRCEEKGDISVSLKTEGENVKLPSRRDGSYLVFSAPPSGELSVTRSQAKKIIIAVFIILAVLIILGFFIYLQKHFPSEGKVKKDTNGKPKKKSHKKAGSKKAKKAPKRVKNVKKAVQNETLLHAGFEAEPEKKQKRRKKRSAVKADISAEGEEASPLHKDDISAENENGLPLHEDDISAKRRSVSSTQADDLTAIYRDPDWRPPEAPAAPKKPAGSRLDIVIGDGVDRRN